ncbi:polysaccharide biosynthesis protein [Streptococcus iners]|uniref:Nucleoside-diphosphate sugar epimerase/dehydratase n=1 Tax=Streptococcus iners TaxID=3028084 RepID=A0AA97A470_9STRE|nr:nucleoside-diphosphate sugar epimerase/dehydratase [Streptococcus sp. 29887]MCK4026014.1 polysaccharide biosynthesis protein [Streptococcus suis]WNY51739.1 nucleoside-diphosphate sugar epimerase/dehydratase [Streptococcus sp. 29887]
MDLGTVTDKLLERNSKRLILMFMDSCLIILSMILSRLFLDIIVDISDDRFYLAVLFILIFYLIISVRLKVFSLITRYTGYQSFIKIGLSLFSAHVIFLILSIIIWQTFSYRFILVSIVLSFVMLITPRIIWKVMHDTKKNALHKADSSLRILVVGAGDGGNIFINTVKDRKLNFEIVGIVDRDPNKLGTFIRNVKVLGNRNDIPRLVEELAVDQVTIAIPSLNGKEREKVVEICNSIGVKVNNMPSIEDILAGNMSVSAFQEIDVADLLGRPEVELDQEELNHYFEGKTILVTGAGGSIGSELCRQIVKFSPKRLLLLGHGENSIYLIHRELSGKCQDKLELIPLIADIQDRDLLFEIMVEYKPDLVYHAAAHKHVPLMEYNPHEAVKNNIFGTKNVAEAAKAARVEKFVMVSTDKAVNPPNVMGATKRVAEMIVTGLNEPGQTQFAAVRFGNVLGSRGSVVPLFKEQIKKGGPVTVTDFRMTRYFMTIPEASRLVIQAGHLAQGGEIFVLDMGEPVHIIELARKVILLSGHTEDEIGIVESGIRPGEKLYEELLSTEERVSEQIHEKIFVGRVTNKADEVVQTFIDSLLSKDKIELRNVLLEFAKQE